MNDYLPNISNIDTLLDASEISSISDNAVENLDELAVAHYINYAADCGQKKIVWQRPMTEVIKSKLEGLGYKITPIVERIARPGYMYVVEWE